MISTYTRQYKIVLVGDQTVGKTSIIKRFIDETYEEILLKTIGVTFTHKTFSLNGETIKLSLYDLSGQQKFHSVAPCIYNHSNALILCYDVTNPHSFQNLRDYWLKELENHNRSHCSIFMMGNKIDEAERKVKKEDVLQLAKANHIEKVYQVSAKQNTNIEESFTDLASILLSSPHQTVNLLEAQKCKLTHQHFPNQEANWCYKH